MNSIVYIFMFIAMGAVVLSLLLGLGVMIKGGKTNEKYGNKLMQARVMLQGLAIALFALAFMMSDKQ